MAKFLTPGVKPAMTPEKQALINGNPAAKGVYDTGVEDLKAKQLAASQAQTWGDARAGNWGTMAGSFAAGMFGEGPGGQAAQYGAQNAGDLLGGLARAGQWQKEAAGAATRAGAFAEAGNEQARAGLMKEAGARADAMNLQNEARGAALTDSAIAADSAFGSGMQGIDSSGIEGSGNMERNLQYGKSRSEAARDMEHQMMGQEAQGLGDSLVQSFDDLSQSKAGAMQAAWGGSIAGNSAALSEGYRQTGAEVMKFQPSRNDAEAVVEQAAAAAEQNPALPGEEPGAQAPAEADVDMANRQTVMGEDARMAEQAAQAQQQTAPAEPAQAAGAAQPVAKMGLEDLVKLRNRYKGGADKAFAAGGQFEGYDMDEVQNTINSLLSNKTRHNGKGTLQGY